MEITFDDLSENEKESLTNTLMPYIFARLEAKTKEVTSRPEMVRVTDTDTIKKLFSFSPRTVDRLAKRHGIKKIVLGNVKLWKVSDIENAIEEEQKHGKRH